MKSDVDFLTEQDIAAMGFQRTSRGWRPLSSVVDGLTRGQWRRWSYVTLEGTLAIRNGSLRAFDVAVRLGKIARNDVGYVRGRGKRPGARQRGEVGQAHLEDGATEPARLFPTR